ncbi:MAG: ParB N-terminal domain-containing protein [Anaerotignum propionicum]|nr:ParB N-terminal domain-containing protein [Anaerotignum propionicum]MEA5057758.1 ParB N-terminal domain-containing protein [Anaerotignum propionicum]
MAQKFNLNQLLTEVSKEAASGGGVQTSANYAASEIKKISVYDLIPSDDNFYSMNDIDELKDKIELAGKVLQNIVVVPLDSGKYKVISGHRRRMASIALVEEGKPQYEFVPCTVEENEADAEVQAIREEIMLIAANSQREKTAWDKLEEVRRTRNILERAKKQEKIPGGTRDLVAKALHTSPAQIGRYDAIIKNLSPTFTEELKQDHINISTAYELSGLTQEEQSVAFAEYKESGTISIKDARAKKPDPVQAETKPVQKEPLRPTTQHKIQSEREKLAAPVIEDFGTMQTSLIEENSDQPQLELAPEQNEPPKESTGCSYAKMYAEMIGEAINAIEFMINEAKKNHEVTISISDVEPLEAALAILKNFNSGRSRR